MLISLLRKFTEHVIWTDPESAEMVKHALNCYLGLNIAFINEIARVCHVVGADPDTVAAALLAERRVSPHAPLRPGPPYGGGHLARDIYNLGKLVQHHSIHAPLLTHIKASNDVQVPA